VPALPSADVVGGVEHRNPRNALAAALQIGVDRVEAIQRV
jgi:hypothetical protein